MLYIIPYLCSEFTYEVGYLFVYYSLSGTYSAVKYICNRRKPIMPEKINYCPAQERCILNNEDDFEVVITEATAIYDIQRLLKQK